MNTLSSSSGQIPLSLHNVQLGARVASREAAIRAVGQLLVDHGYIEPGYVESMLAREKQANTFLGNGIAIPHGQGKDRELIRRTAIAVLQVPDGVAWNGEEVAKLIVGIAARSDEHIEILAALTDVLTEPAQVARLVATTNAGDIIAALVKKESPASAEIETWPDAQEIDVMMPEGAGLHARPATRLAEVANRFSSEIRVLSGAKAANAKAMAAMLRLGAEAGANLRLQARGADASEALAVLRDEIESGLGDTDESAAATVGGETWTPTGETRMTYEGVPASSGLAIGPIFRVHAEKIRVEDWPSEPESERVQFQSALLASRETLQRLALESETKGAKTEAEIFHAHLGLLNDSELTGEVTALIDARHRAAWAWHQVIARRVAEMQALKNERLAGRAADLSDVGGRVLRNLTGGPSVQADGPAVPSIWLADDMSPSEMARLDPGKITALCTASGGPNSHVAIIARAKGLPAVVAAGAGVLALKNGDIVIVDGTAGKLYAQPDAQALQSAKTFLETQRANLVALGDARFRPAIMTDGHRVEISANIGSAQEAADAVTAGAEGVGLLRTEFLFLGREAAPDEEEQFQAYRQMIRALDGLPIIIRTLDIGGDKHVPYLDLPKEQNPFLGVRGIRLCLRRPELFKTQLRAIYRAAKDTAPGAVKLMFPMVTTLEDVRAAKMICEEVRLAVDGPKLETGIMVEVPSAVLMAKELAREVDFFSIGTNDLTQYALAIDREHPELGKEADALHPAVLRLIDLTVKAAEGEGKWVGVCGGSAGDPLGATILAGLGVTELSMSAPQLAQVKARLRTLSLKSARKLAQRALSCSTAQQVRALTSSK